MLKLIFFFIVSCLAPQPSSDWWHDMDSGGAWHTSSNLARNNPYYNTYRQIDRQMDTYGPAQHVGKINRGSYLNPELNSPSVRALGIQSDFNPQDLQPGSGVFKYKPQGQKYRASEVHVNEGLASYVGEEVTMALGQHVQEDGTILIQTNGRGNPCHPNPCKSVRMPTCTVVNSFTAKCSRALDYKLTLSYIAPGGNPAWNNMWLYLVPAFHNGSESACDGDYMYGGEEGGCGVELDPDYWDYAYDYLDPNLGDKTHTLTLTDDGAKYQDYTYQVIAEYDDDGHYLDDGFPQLTVEYGGQVVQVLKAPQFDGTTDVDPDVSDKEFYFFGCFRPQLGLVDTRGAGFFDSDYEVDFTNGLELWDASLCKELLKWPGTLGYHQK